MHELRKATLDRNSIDRFYDQLTKSVKTLYRHQRVGTLIVPANVIRQIQDAEDMGYQLSEVDESELMVPVKDEYTPIFLCWLTYLLFQ